MFGSKNRSQSKRDREALIASMPVDEDGCVPEKYLLERNGLRSKRALMADGRSTAKKVYPSRMPPEQAASWVMNPGRYDVEGIDTRSPANVERKGTRPTKPKAPARKPAGPKAKAPSSPVPERDPGVVLSGQEIMDTVKLIASVSGNAPVNMGYDRYSMSSDARVKISLTRMDGKGLFGLDADVVKDRAIASPAPIGNLLPMALYKISVEGDELLFRRGPDFSEVELSVPIVTPMSAAVSVASASERFSRYESDVEFDLDAVEMRRAADSMAQLKCDYCTLATGSWGAHLIADIKPKMRRSMTEKIDRKVGGPTNRNMTSMYTVQSIRRATKEASRYITDARYGDGEPLIMEGTFGEYRLTVVVLDTGTTR